MGSISICILGGTGFVGTALAAALARRGDAVTVLTRNAARGRHLAVVPGLRLAQCDPHDPAALAAAFRGQDAVVNLVGSAAARGSAGFHHVHAEFARKVVAACRATHVHRLLHVSALNAGPHAPSHFLRSKGAGERIVREESHADLDWTIFQPAPVFGAGDVLLSRLAAQLRALPVLPVARPGTRLAPVWVEDLVAALLCALDDPAATAGESFELCGPRAWERRELAGYVRDLLGLRRPVLGLPEALALPLAALADLLPGMASATDRHQSLAVDAVCRGNGFARLGLRPTALEVVAPRYLGAAEENARFDRWRRTARRSQ